MSDYTLHLGDCRAILPTLAPASIDAIVTDPPYELGFMGRAWDKSGIANDVGLWREVLRVAKPGAHLLAFSGTRTSHRMVCAIEDAGWEIRDSIQWIYATGFPKSLNLGGGRGTALKPAHEPICLARKPVEGTIAGNVLAHGVGGLNIDGCRIGTSKDIPASPDRNRESWTGGWPARRLDSSGNNPNIGRWPANVVFDEHAALELDRQSGVRKSGAWNGHRNQPKTQDIYGAFDLSDERGTAGDSGFASRFFYVSKPSRAERDAGCSNLPEHSGGELTGRADGSAGLNNPRAGAGRTSGGRNAHPTVKPLELMRYLVRLITPPNGVVLDMFMGSGTTGAAALAEGFRFVGVDMGAEYVELSRSRLRALGIRQHTVFEVAI